MTEKLKVNCIDHISIAVKDLKKAEEDFRRAFGWEVDGRYADHDEKINVAYFMIGGTAFEIMEDTDGTGEVARFIAQHGEGSWSFPEGRQYGRVVGTPQEKWS